MKIRNVIALVACAAILTACQSATILSTDNYHPQKHARIRLYGQNQKPTIMEYVHENRKTRENVGGKLGDVLSSFAGATTNVSLGMPKTGMINYMQKYDGILSKVFYREFAVPAGVTVRVHNAFVGLGTFTRTAHYTSYVIEASCVSDTVTFTPQAGRDYEVVPIYNSRSCGVAVLDITSVKSPAQQGQNE